MTNSNSLIPAGANLEKTDIYGRTALMICAHYGQAIEVDALIQAGANLNAQEPGGNTALNFAAFSPHATIDIINTFIRFGANLEIKNNLDQTALFFAAKAGDGAKVDALIQAGANINEKDIYGNIPLSYMVDYMTYNDCDEKNIYPFLRVMSLENINAAVKRHPILNDVVNKFKQEKLNTENNLFNKLSNLVQNHSEKITSTPDNLTDLKLKPKTLILSQQNNLKPFPRKNDELDINTDKIAQMIKAKRAA